MTMNNITGEMEVRTYNLQKAIDNWDIAEAERLHEGYAREIAQLLWEMRWLASVEKDWMHDTTMMKLFSGQYHLNWKHINILQEVQEATKKLLGNKL